MCGLPSLRPGVLAGMEVSSWDNSDQDVSITGAGVTFRLVDLSRIFWTPAHPGGQLTRGQTLRPLSPALLQQLPDVGFGVTGLTSREQLLWEDEEITPAFAARGLATCSRCRRDVTPHGR